MNEYLAFQLYIQVFWKVVLVYSALYITVQCLFLLVIDIEETSYEWISFDSVNIDSKYFGSSFCLYL